MDEVTERCVMVDQETYRIIKAWQSTNTSFSRFMSNAATLAGVNLSALKGSDLSEACEDYAAWHKEYVSGVGK